MNYADEMIALKRSGAIRGIIVSGCLAERQKEQLLEERPDIDALVGVFGTEEVTLVADRLLGNLEEAILAGIKMRVFINFARQLECKI